MKIKWNGLKDTLPVFDQQRLFIVRDGRGFTRDLYCDEIADFDNLINRLKGEREEMDLPITWIEVSSLQAALQASQAEVERLRGAIIEYVGDLNALEMNRPVNPGQYRKVAEDKLKSALKEADNAE